MERWYIDSKGWGKITYTLTEEGLEDLHKTLKKLVPVAKSTAKDIEVSEVEISIPGYLEYDIESHMDKNHVIEEIEKEYNEILLQDQASMQDKNPNAPKIKEKYVTEIKDYKMYTDAKQFAEDLKKVKSIDFFSKTTTLKDATEWGKSLMKLLVRTGDLNLNKQEIKQIAKELKNAGALTFREIKKLDRNKFPDKNFVYEGEVSQAQNLSFPLSVLANFFKSPIDVAFVIDKGAGGKEKSWIADWIVDQEYYDQREREKAQDEVESE